MIEVTLQLPDDLALRVQRLQRWLPALLDLSLAGFRTAATETATEVLEFLEGEPTPQAVLAYHVSEQAQHRLQRPLLRIVTNPTLSSLFNTGAKRMRAI